MQAPARRAAAPRRQHHALWLCALSAAALSACGGGGGQDASPTASALADAQPLVITAEAADHGLPADAAQLQAVPTFHAAPVLLDAPADADPGDPSATALQAPHVQTVPADTAGLPTQRLGVDDLLAARRSHALATTTGEGAARPLATATVVATYTPAQVRAAYGLPVLPAAGAKPTAAQAAALGAGQTIYIVAARHNPNVAAELAAFNQKFALPGCTTRALPAGTALPLAAASATACEFLQVYATAGGAATATVPAYDAGWATEIALDVQWAHATAPLARIVLVEAPDPSTTSLVGAVKLANAMGPGVVSMSFGAPEGNFTAASDSAFSAPRMSYLAATGDAGAAVSWPSVSPYVLAVGGTRLTTGSGARSEVAWTGTGGGVSAATALPAYQGGAVPGFTGYARRTVADVAFNADPSTGQYLAVMAQGATSVSWLSAGGTSLATPQWAGLLAVANAQRALAGKAALGQPHPVLYGQVAAVPGSYASAFADIGSGRNGSCTLCVAKAGYDLPTGLGTPNAASLLALLANGSTVVATPVAPAVASASVSGVPGKALSATVSVNAANPVAWSLAGAPAGLTISSAGVITWASPVAGSYSITVTARDSLTGLSGQGVLSLQIVKPGPVITAPAMAGVAGKLLTGNITIGNASPGALAISIGGAPAGMVFSFSNLVLTAQWARPVTGSYALNLKVTDGSGYSAAATVAVKVTAK